MDLFFIILVLLSTIAYSIEKKVLKDLTLIEFWVLYTILSFIIAIVVLCITKYVLKHPTNIIEKINCKNGFNWIFYSLVIVVILISISTIFQMKYLKNNDLGIFIPVSKTVAIVMGFLLGIIINNEKPCFNQYCGIVAMIIGVFLLCKNKKN
jgi:drug/metabolite transporter (DMT)-like permease